MRKISLESSIAFSKGLNYKNANTQVVIQNGITSLYLHNNKIAERNHDSGLVMISNSGWFTTTTKERLNSLEGVHIIQKAGVWYLNGKEWNGHFIPVLAN